MDEVTLEDAWIMIFKFLGEGDGEAGEGTIRFWVTKA